MLPILFLTALLPAWAHGPSHGDAPSSTELHVGYDYDSCYIDLHPELTRSDFHRFTRSFSDSGSFSALSGAATLGPGRVAVGVALQRLTIDDSRPEWNHSFTHPGEDHWLGHPNLPILQTRVGLHPRLDVEAMITGDPNSNWGLVGYGARVSLVEPGTLPIDLAARGTVQHLLGAAELDHHTVGGELLASRAIGPLTPYAGLGTRTALSIEHTDELDLGSAWTGSVSALAGAELALGPVRVAGQVTLATAPTVSFLAGAAF